MDVVGAILEQCAELEILFPRPDFIRGAIARWSSRNFQVWDRLYKTTQLEYNPVSNYDRNEEWEENAERDNTDNTVGKTTGYNSNELVTATGADSTANSKQRGTRRGRTWGNIGVTTTQEMIEQERNVSRFNIVDEIVDSFKEEFCILVY